MKKTGISLLCIFVLSFLSFFITKLSTSNPLVDSSGCLECHEVGQFGAQDGSLHGSHSNCADCHDGSPGLGNVSSSACIDCHPFPSPGLCQLVNLHEGSLGYNPSGASCIDCHSDCDGGSTTTTTTGPPSSLAGTRWEVFVVGPFREGCTATTLNFRSDNVLTLDCLEGFGEFLSVGGAFSAVYWSNNAYQGYNLGMVLTGIAFKPYIIIIGVAYYGNIITPVLLIGYIL
ncbi:MAG: hypothetical protein R3339_11100 [Thermodesulfobacteriota bacterium]|nr:hypothetical protein [Thermodesulfobacteriota bacterium]